MSWASRRRTSYASGVILFFAIVIGGPIAYHFLTIPPTCFDGIQNQGETAPDRGGPCLLLDPQYLSPSGTLWARSFRVRDGSYNSIAYIQNPNKNAGVASVSYRFGLYDADNIIVAEREGTTYLMPGTVTPVFEGNIDTGNRIVTHTYFEFTGPLVWERMNDTSGTIEINDKQISNTGSTPLISASAKNNSVDDLQNVTFVVAVFDPAGNAFAASETALPTLSAGDKQTIVFTWPDPFPIQVGRYDIIPLSPPAPAPVQ